MDYESFGLIQRSCSDTEVEYNEYGHLSSVDLEEVVGRYYSENIDYPDGDYYEDLG